jgi:hypothetical protein
MLRKSLFLLLATVLAVSLMFTGCPNEIEYRDVPGPERIIEVAGDTVYVDKEIIVDGETVTVHVPVDADTTVATENDLRQALLDDSYETIAVIATFSLKGDLEIPAGKEVHLYVDLTPDDYSVIDVQGKLVAIHGTVEADIDHQITVADGGALIVRQNGQLIVDTPAAVTSGGSTAFGTNKVVIDGPDAALEITDDSVLTVELVRTAYQSYLTQGYLRVTALKLSELAAIADPADAGKKGLYATAASPEATGTDIAITIPANAYLTTYNPDTLGSVKSLTINGRLDVSDPLAKLDKVTTLVLNGSLSAAGPTFADVEEFTVKGYMNLAGATFAKLTSLTLEPGASLEAPAATFAALTSLSVPSGATLEAPKATFTNLAGSLSVDGTIIIQATATIAQLFPKVTELTVSGRLETGGATITKAFEAVTTLSVTGTGVLDTHANGFTNLATLQVASGGLFTASGNVPLAKVTTLTAAGDINVSSAAFGALTELVVSGSLTANGSAAFKALTGLTVQSGAELHSTSAAMPLVATLTVDTGATVDAPGATWPKVTTLVLNGELDAPAGTFALLTDVRGNGVLVAGAVPISAKANPALTLFNSALSSVTLKNTDNFLTKTNLSVTGVTRTFEAAGGDIPSDGTITVGSGGVLNFNYSSAAPAAPITVNSGGKIVFGNDSAAPAGAIEVNSRGVLVFDGDSVAPTGVISVAGTLSFNGDDAAPAADITVERGGALTFNGVRAVPAGDITAEGGIVVGNRADVTIAAAKTLELSEGGLLTAGSLELKGVSYAVPSGGSLVISGTGSGSLTASGASAFNLDRNGYIKDTTYRKSWTLAASTPGTFAYAGSTGFVLGDGRIESSEASGLAVTPSSEDGVFTLTGNGTSITAHKPEVSTAQGLSLINVIIDLTTEGSIVVEKGGKLILAKADADGNIDGAGVITIDNASNTGEGAKVGSVGVTGDLTKLANGNALAGLNSSDGIIGNNNSKITIDRNFTL